MTMREGVIRTLQRKMDNNRFLSVKDECDNMDIDSVKEPRDEEDADEVSDNEIKLERRRSSRLHRNISSNSNQITKVEESRPIPPPSQIIREGENPVPARRIPSVVKSERVVLSEGVVEKPKRTKRVVKEKKEEVK